MGKTKGKDIELKGQEDNHQKKNSVYFKIARLMTITIITILIMTVMMMMMMMMMIICVT